MTTPVRRLARIGRALRLFVACILLSLIAAPAPAAEPVRDTITLVAPAFAAAVIASTRAASAPLASQPALLTTELEAVAPPSLVPRAPRLRIHLRDCRLLC